jgi:hypothetical protein
LGSVADRLQQDALSAAAVELGVENLLDADAAVDDGSPAGGCDAVGEGGAGGRPRVGSNRGCASRSSE